MNQELSDLYGIDLTIYFFYKIQGSAPDDYSQSLDQQNNKMWSESVATTHLLLWMNKNVGYY